MQWARSSYIRLDFLRRFWVGEVQLVCIVGHHLNDLFKRNVLLAWGSVRNREPKRDIQLCVRPTEEQTVNSQRQRQESVRVPQREPGRNERAPIMPDHDLSIAINHMRVSTHSGDSQPCALPRRPEEQRGPRTAFASSTPQQPAAYLSRHIQACLAR